MDTSGPFESSEKKISWNSYSKQLTIQRARDKKIASPTLYEISARIEGGFNDLDVVCAFDPTKVVVRLREEFPGTEVDPTDRAWHDYKIFLRMGLTEEQEMERPTALGVAARDARRRAPVWLFRVPSSTTWVSGGAERHYVWFRSETPFPEPLRSDLLRFVEGLRFAPCVSIKCVRTEGNEEHPA